MRHSTGGILKQLSSEINKEEFDKVKDSMNPIMKILDLPLKKEWYNMIESGVKPEEYREIKGFWIKRFTDIELSKIVNFINSIKPNPRDTYDNGVKVFDGVIRRSNYYNPVTYGNVKHYDAVRFRYGYTKKTMLFELKSINVGIGNPEWGAPDNEVFILKLGNRIN